MLVLKMQPSEIANLEMPDYLRWVDVCGREIDRRIEAAEKMRSQ